MTSQQLITGWEKKQELRLSMDHFIGVLRKTTIDSGQTYLSRWCSNQKFLFEDNEKII